MNNLARGGSHVFTSELFCLTVPKLVVGEPFNVAEYLGYRKIFCMIGGITGSIKKF